ncbi:hypothetical protein ACS0TY_022911 [Phlomoides rotata]
MALSHLLQPKLNLPIFRLRLSTATARVFTSSHSNGDIDNPPPSKKEAATVGTGITPAEHSVKESLEEKKGFFSKAASVLGLVGRYIGPTKSESLPVQFTEHNGHQTETKVENEGRKAEAALSGDQNVRCEGVEKSSQSDICPEVSRLKSASDGSALEIDKDNHTETTAENEGRKAEAALSDNQNVRCEGVGRSSQSDSSPKVIRLKSASGGSALEIDKPTNSKRPPIQFTEHKDKQTKTTAENEGRKAEAALLDYQNVRCEAVERSLQSDTSPKVLGLKSPTDGSALEIDEPRNLTSSGYCSSTDLIEDKSLNARSDDNVVLNLLDFLDSSIDSDNKTIDLKDLITCFKVPTVNEDQRQRQNTCPARTESVENRVITIKGFEKALRKSGSLIQNASITVESATVMEKKTLKIPIPGLLGDPDIPSALIKNPTRTIKVESLTKETSSHHIAEALAFCKSSISGYTLGSSHSVAYVEFESEIGKERALAKQSINVLGRQLVMLRIDCPRTTVVRISTKHNINQKEARSICRSLGDVNIVKLRCPSTLDVHFKLTEWPNMVKILNGLNGRMVNGQRCQAEPAPVFPPEVLLALWHHPEEIKCLEATAQVLLHKLSELSDTSVLASLEKDLFCKI